MAIILKFDLTCGSQPNHPFAGVVIGQELVCRAKVAGLVPSIVVVSGEENPIAPHLLFPQFLSEETERELAIFMDLVLLGKCEQLWVFGGEVSDGMRREIGRAKQKNMTIRYFTEDMEETECR